MRLTIGVTKMKSFFIGLMLGIALIIGYFVHLLLSQPDISITAYRKYTGYQGPICSIAVTTKNIPYCSNGVAYNKGSIIGEESYQLWATCKAYPDAKVCGELND
jgi:hypothetical protein